MHRLLRSGLTGLLVLAALFAASPAPAVAQAGMGTDIITGTVTDEDDNPIEDAAIEAYSLETQITRRARTDARGRFTILFPDGGGQYRMTVRALGKSPRIELVQRHADEDRLIWNVRLTGGAVTLDAITVRAGPQMLRAPDGPTPGSSERAFLEGQISRLPLDATDLTLLASLVPGVLTIDATDTTATAFSVAGLGPEANALTLDGLLFGSSSMPQEALRQTRVVTSTYDVSRGQFSGGLIAATTRSGSNVMQGSSQYQLSDDELAVPEDDSPYAQGHTQHVLSGGLGGPVRRDRAFVFGSLQARLRSDPQQTLLSAASADYSRLGVHPDSVARFFSILDGLGVPHSSVTGGRTRSNDNMSALVRFDYVLSNSHTVTLRGDWRGTAQDPTRLGPLALPQAGGVMETAGSGAMLTLTSRFGATVLNEFRGYWQNSSRDGEAYTSVPAGRVQVASDLPDGSRGVSTLVFGGNSGLPTTSRSSSFEASNELSWLPGRGAHRFKLGGFFLADRSRNVLGNNQLGTYTFNSLNDLEVGRASTFRRAVRVTERESESYRWGMFAGDVWMVSRPFQLTYGVRVEGSSFGTPPARNAAVETAFGRRTDRLPSETHLSPRVGFTWTLGGSQFVRGRPPAPPTLVIRGGFGEFRSQPPATIVAQARSATGFDQGEGDVSCTGLSVPFPDWRTYWLDPAAIPGECTGGSPTPGSAQPARTVMVLAEDFQAPRAWRGSLGFERRLTQIFRLTLEGSFAHGVSQTGYRDLNLRSQVFALGSEGGRPMFVAPSDITPGTGAPRFSASRVNSAFGQVLEASSDLRSRSGQVTLGIGGIVRRGIILQTSYTWQRVREEATGAGGGFGRGGNTAGDPNVAEWSRSSLERRHAFLATVTYPFSQALELTSIGRLTSGTPYTPVVGGDVNGDGLRNDRAFVFGTGTATPEAAGMERLLAQSSAGVRDCLASQFGTVAARNSCTGPWQYSLDFQFNWRPNMAGLNRRLTVSLVTTNFLRGLDQLVNGSDNTKGWGLAARPDNTLLYATGFDPATQRYSYEINERFGATTGTATAFRPPFQVGIRMRLTLGPDRMRQALDAMRAGGGAAVMARMGGGDGPGGGFGGQGGFRGGAMMASPEQMMTRLESALPNPAGAALGMRDSLRLTPAQVSLLEPVRDSLASRTGARLDSLRRGVAALGNNPDPMRLLPMLRPQFEAARNDIAQSAVTVRAILTPEQWEQLPENVRNLQSTTGPMMMIRPGGQGPGGAGPRPRP